MVKWKEVLFKGSKTIDSDIPDEPHVKGTGNLVRRGECNHCGKCCIRSGGLMVENPMMELTEDQCKFYVDKVKDKLYGHCLIYGRGAKPLKSVKDRHSKTITDEQIKWFNENCIEYPRVTDAEAGYMPLKGCGFRFEEQV